MVERIFDRVLGWSYTEPNDEQAIKTPPSAKQSFYDLAGDVGYSMQRTIRERLARGYSEATEWHAQNVSFRDLKFGGLTQAQEVHVYHGSIMSYILSLETRRHSRESESG